MFNKKIMKQIKNIVFDFGGVVIGLDREQAVKAFERIGVREKKQMGLREGSTHSYPVDSTLGGSGRETRVS